MTEEHPAMVASRSSWRCVQSHDKEAWLDLMAEDVCIEDPIGQAPTNPDGKGVRGKAAVSDFYDKNIAHNNLTIECQESHLSSSPLEAAHVLKLTSEFPNGVTTVVTGIFTYMVNEEGKLTNLRGFWNLGAMAVTQPDG